MSSNDQSEHPGVPVFGSRVAEMVPSWKKQTQTLDSRWCAAAIVAHCFASASERDVRISHEATSSSCPLRNSPSQKSPPPEWDSRAKREASPS